MPKMQIGDSLLNKAAKDAAKRYGFEEKDYLNYRSEVFAEIDWISIKRGIILISFLIAVLIILTIAKNW